MQAENEIGSFMRHTSSSPLILFTRQENIFAVLETNNPSTVHGRVRPELNEIERKGAAQMQPAYRLGGSRPRNCRPGLGDWDGYPPNQPRRVAWHK